MDEQAAAWLQQAREDLGAAADLLGEHDTIALFHAHQAAEKALKAAQIDRDGDYARTHDLVRLHRETGAPDRFGTVLEELNPAYTASRYPDVDDPGIASPETTVDRIREVIEWIEQRSTA